MTRALTLATLLLAAMPLAAALADVAVGGDVRDPRAYSVDDLKAQPATEVEVSYEGGHGPAHATYTGVLLWTLVTAAGPIDAPGERTFLQHSILVRGADGYAVSLAIGELDPNFESKSVIVAYLQDGKPLDQPRLVVPGDHKGGRSVRDVTKIVIH